MDTVTRVVVSVAAVAMTGIIILLGVLLYLDIMHPPS